MMKGPQGYYIRNPLISRLFNQGLIQFCSQFRHGNQERYPASVRKSVDLCFMLRATKMRTMIRTCFTTP